MKAQYSSKNKNGVWGEYTVVNFSCVGTGLIFHTHEKIDVGSVGHAKVFAPDESESIDVKGKL